MKKYIKVLLMLAFTISVSTTEASSYLYKVIGKSEEPNRFNAVAGDGSPVLLKMSCEGFMGPNIYAEYEVRGPKGAYFKKIQVYPNATECKFAERVLSQTTPDMPIFIVKAVTHWNATPSCTVKLDGVLSVVLRQQYIYTSIDDFSAYIKSFVVEKSQERLIKLGQQCL